MKEYSKKLMYLSLILYMILLIWVVIFKWTNYQAAQECVYTYRKFNLIQRLIACNQCFFRFDFIDIVLNILIFLPMGLYFVVILSKKQLILLIGLTFSLIFEISQFFTCIGMFNIFDVIGNVIGCAIGYLLFLISKKIINKRLINVLNIVIILFCTPQCIYAIIMTIINFNYYL